MGINLFAGYFSYNPYGGVGWCPKRPEEKLWVYRNTSNKSGDNQMEINLNILRRMLKRTNLGGLLEECVLEEGDKGYNHIRAIDLTNSLILSVTGKTKMDGFDKLGFGDLSTLTKYLDVADDETKVDVEKNRMVFKGKGGSFKYLLSDPELIPTAMEDKDAIKKLVDACTHEVDIEEEVQKSFLMSMGLVKTNSVVFHLDGKNLRLLGGLETEHQFDIKVGAVKSIGDSKRDKFNIPVFGTHLAAVFTILDWTNRENAPKLMLKEGRPVIIKQNRDTWCITIVTESEK